jgi:hypothetical protein
MIEDNGILARIMGKHVSDAMRALPAAERSHAEVIETELDVPDIGRVRFTMRRHGSKKGRRTHYFWSAEKAALVE